MTPSLKASVAILAVSMVLALRPIPAASARPGLWAAAQGSSAPAAAVTGPARAEERYTGQHISLDHQNVDIRKLLALIGEAAGKNMVVPDSVRGRVTVKLTNVPWDQALDLILASKNLGVEISGNVLMVDDLPKLIERGIYKNSPVLSEQGGEGVEVLFFSP